MKELRELEDDGVVAEVLFPNTIPPFFPSGNLLARPPTSDTYELRWAGLRAIAMRFDLLILRLQLSVLRAEPGFERLRDQVKAIAPASGLIASDVGTTCLEPDASVKENATKYCFTESKTNV